MDKGVLPHITPINPYLGGNVQKNGHFLILIVNPF